MRKQPRAITRHGSLFELKREQARDAVAAHKDAVDDLRRGHGDAVVRNHDDCVRWASRFKISQKSVTLDPSRAASASSCRQKGGGLISSREKSNAAPGRKGTEGSNEMEGARTTAFEPISPVLLLGLVYKATCSPLEFTTPAHSKPLLERLFRWSMAVLLRRMQSF
jgi:hypothetical protein